MHFRNITKERCRPDLELKSCSIKRAAHVKQIKTSKLLTKFSFLRPSTKTHS